MEKGGPSGKGIQITLPPAGGGRLSRLPAALSCPREAERKAMPPLAGRRMPLPLTAIARWKKTSGGNRENRSSADIGDAVFIRRG